MIDPPRPYIMEDGTGHYDKFHWTVDIEKYPNEKFIIFGLFLDYNNNLKILFIPHWECEIGKFNFNNELESVDKLSKEGMDNLPFCFFENIKFLTWGNKKVAWRNVLYWNKSKNLLESGGKYYKFPNPIIIEGLQNIKIKGVLK